MRLNRFIANAGVCSRREADTFIEAGMVTVNGKPVTELGIKVKSTDEVRFDGRRLNPEKKEIIVVSRTMLEEEDGQQLFEAAMKGKVVFCLFYETGC